MKNQISDEWVVPQAGIEPARPFQTTDFGLRVRPGVGLLVFPAFLQSPLPIPLILIVTQLTSLDVERSGLDTAPQLKCGHSADTGRDTWASDFLTAPLSACRRRPRATRSITILRRRDLGPA